MSNAKEEALFETLRGACSRQYGFNPRRVTAEMRYVGKEGHGKDQVHVFRDSKTHSQIVLKNTFATLRETHGDKPHWSEAEKAHYKETDAEIDAQIRQRQAEMEYARQSPLYLEHRDQLLSHYKDSPNYQAGSTNPREAPISVMRTWRPLQNISTPMIQRFWRIICCRLAISISRKA
jgi:hypothetical protein